MDNSKSRQLETVEDNAVDPALVADVRNRLARLGQTSSCDDDDITCLTELLPTAVLTVMIDGGRVDVCLTYRRVFVRATGLSLRPTLYAAAIRLLANFEDSSCMQ